MDFARLIDHTNLKPQADAAAIDQLVAEAVEHGFASVCVNGCYVARVVRALAGTEVRACGVAGFPLGAMKPMVKAIEATVVCKDGAQELDFVAHLPHLLAEDLDAARQDMLSVTQAAREVNPQVVIKVIIESAVLMHDVSPQQSARRIEIAATAARESGCDFIKTSTGFHPLGGATAEAVALMKRLAGPLKVKAAGGISSRDDALMMVQAGAERLGCSAGVAIVRGAVGESGY